MIACLAGILIIIIIIIKIMLLIFYCCCYCTTLTTNINLKSGNHLEAKQRDLAIHINCGTMQIYFITSNVVHLFNNNPLLYLSSSAALERPLDIDSCNQSRVASRE